MPMGIRPVSDAGGCSSRYPPHRRSSRWRSGLNKQIADNLGISIETLESHRANIMEKLNVDTVADLLRLPPSKNS